MNFKYGKKRFKKDIKGCFEYYREHSAQMFDSRETKKLFDGFASEVGDMKNLAGISIVAAKNDGSIKTIVCGNNAMLVFMATFLVNEVEDIVKEPLEESLFSMMRHYIEEKDAAGKCKDN